MKRITFLCAILLTLFALQVGSVAAEDGEKTLVGEYNWNQGVSGELKAIFTPDGDGRWQVDFYFDFRSAPHVYSGTAKGSLDGTVEGTVKNDSKNRTFTFEGAFKDGVFEGKHAETTPGRARATGTLNLK